MRAKLHFKKKKKKVQAGNDLLNILPKSSHVREKSHRMLTISTNPSTADVREVIRFSLLCVVLCCNVCRYCVVVDLDMIFMVDR